GDGHDRGPAGGPRLPHGHLVRAERRGAARDDVRPPYRDARGGLLLARRADRALRGAHRPLDVRPPLVPGARALEGRGVHGGQLQALARRYDGRSLSGALRQGRPAAGGSRPPDHEAPRPEHVSAAVRRALIVDFGGVLTTNVFESFRAFSEAEGLDPDAVKRLFRERREGLDLLRQLERGQLSVEEFSERFGPLLGVRETDGMVERLFAGVQANERMVEAVRRVKASGRPTGLISNSWGGVSYDRVATDELFDAMVISGEVGLNKPEPEISRLGAERLGVAPE